MSNPTDPLDRLNYYNGQRLEAGDLRLEQEYHIRLRRLLNQSLHTYGIASGLEVLPLTGDEHRVRVSPGLALDEEGRELVLLEEVVLAVSGVPSEIEGVVFGNYLTIRYAETPVAVMEDGCCVPLEPRGKTAWGGPTRLRTSAVLEWQNTWPPAGSGRIVLAQIELDPTCKVRTIRTGVRKYVGQSQPPRTMAYALEGEKDIDAANSKRLGFHVRGGRPQSVLLYLRLEALSTLFYTELGRHTHNINITSTNLGAHTHTLDLGTLTSSEAGGHSHDATANVEDPNDHNALEMHGSDIDNANLNIVNFKILNGGAHTHTLTGGASNTASSGAHAHQVNGGSDPAGQTINARAGSSHAYVNGLRILIDGNEVTAEVQNRLGLTSLGDGTSGHRMAQTLLPPVEIQLDTLGVDLTEGYHTIEFKVNSGGGKVVYNLYVE